MTTECCVVGPGSPDCHECGHVFDGPCCCINDAVFGDPDAFGPPPAGHDCEVDGWCQNVHPSPQRAYDEVIATYYPSGDVPDGSNPADRDRLVEAIMLATAAYDRVAGYPPHATGDELDEDIDSRTDWTA